MALSAAAARGSSQFDARLRPRGSHHPSGVIPPTGWGCPEPGGSGNRVATRHTPWGRNHLRRRANHGVARCRSTPRHSTGLAHQPTEPKVSGSNPDGRVSRRPCYGVAFVVQGARAGSRLAGQVATKVAHALYLPGRGCGTAPTTAAASRAWRKPCSSVGGCRGMESRPCLPMGAGYVRGTTASRRLRLSDDQSSAWS
jgi:hypothetical protein